MNYHELIGYLTNPLVDALKMTDFPSSEQGIAPFLRGKTSLLCEFWGTARIGAYQFLE